MQLPHKMSADLSFGIPSVVTPFSSCETPSPVAIDPRPRMKSTKLVSSTTGTQYLLNTEVQVLNTENPLELHLPLECVLEAISTKVKNRQVLEHHRIFKIDDRLLDALRGISPPLLGGNFHFGKKEDMGHEASVFAQRRNAWVKQLQPYFSSTDLIKIFQLVREIVEHLPLTLWKLPSNHETFRIDGGWEVYILKIHQLILNTMQKAYPKSCQQMDKDLNETQNIPIEIEKEQIVEKQSAGLTSFASVQSNAYETRTLWNACVRAATGVPRRNDEMNETPAYMDNIFRDYHRSDSRCLGSSTCNKLSTNSTSGTTESTATNGSEVSQEVSVQIAVDDPEDIPVNPAIMQSLRNAPPKLTQPSDVQPMDIYITLMDNSSKYQNLGFSMPAIIDAPLNSDGKSEKVAFVYPNLQYRRAIICFDMDLLSFSINASGRYDAYLFAWFIQTVKYFVDQMHWEIQVPKIFKKSFEMIEKRAVQALRVFRACLTEEKWSINKVEYLCHMLMSSNESAVTDTLTELVTHLWHAAFHRNDVKGLKRVEGTLVALLGHADVKIRTRAAVLLNMFYDGHDWQHDVPFVPVIKQIGEAFEVTVCIDDLADPRKKETPEGIVLILSAPSFDPESSFDCYSYHAIDWLPTENVKGRISGMSRFHAGALLMGRTTAPIRHRWIGTVKFENFPRCGFFDWRVVRMNEEYGSWETVQAALSDIRRSASSSRLLDLRISLSPEEREASPDSMGDRDQMVIGKVYPHPQRMAEVLKGLLSPHTLPMFCNEELQTFPLQGRFIVQSRGIQDEQIHEIFIDQHGCEFDKTTGKLTQRGSFASVTSSLSHLRDKGVTMIYLMGALARDNGEMRYLSQGGVEFQREDASPFAVTCRCTPNSMSGGGSELKALLKEARRVGIKVVLDSFTRVASSHAHRKYEPHLLHYLDPEGKKCILYGSGGRAANYEDTVQLNYRKVECWDLLVAEMKVMSNAYCVDGLRLENCHSWPPILQSDVGELQRKDPDGAPHYNVMQQLLTDVVLPFSEDQSGFWSTPSARNWANPFLVKMCKEIWRDHPEFVLIGECLGSERGDDRQSVLARSGVIPQLQDMPEPLAKVFGQKINEDDSSVTPCEPSSVQEIISWFDSAHGDLPEGAVVIQSSCSHLSPLPGLLYGRGAWPAVDLLFFLPDIPSTFTGEMEGQCFRLDITNVFSASAKPIKQEESFTGPSSNATADAPFSSKLVGYRRTAARSLVNLELVGDESSRCSKFKLARAGPKPLSVLRSLGKFEPVAALPKLEEEQIKKVGPEFGFDLKQIFGHYEHRRRLRHRLKIIRSGILVPLNARYEEKWHPRVLAFLRFDAESGEFILVAINFSERQLDNVAISLKALSFQFRDMGLESTTTFMSADLFAITQSECLAQDRKDSKLYKIGSHRELGEVPLMGGQSTLGKIFKSWHTYDEVYSMAELLHKPQVVNLRAYGSVCLGFKPVEPDELTPDMVGKLYTSSLARLQAIVKGSMAHTVVRNEPIPPTLERILRFNFAMESIISSILDSDIKRFASVLVNLRAGLHSLEGSSEGRPGSLHDFVVDSGLFCSEAQRFDPQAWMKLCCAEGGGAAAVLGKKDERTDMAERLVGKMMAVISKVNSLKDPPKLIEDVGDTAREFVESNNIGPVVFITTELGKWSTVGGLGVMVDELSCTLAEHLGQTVYIVTPYYNFDRKGQPAKIDPNELRYKYNINVHIAGENITLGVHEGCVRGVNLIFLHNARFFPHPYPNWNVQDGLRFLSIIGKASLEVLCQERLLPQIIVTNDWPTGLVAAYGKNPHFFGESFSSTTFFHIVHNLDANYEGRIYADRGGNYGWLTELNLDLLVDPSWQNFLFNPSRCALMCSDAWGTVSPSYRDELKRPGGSALGPLLNRYPMPFAYPNGVPLKPRLQRLSELRFKTHSEAKAELQRRYFKFGEPDLSIPLFAFIGRITEQKGVHHIVDAAEQLIQRYQCKIQILICGKVTWTDPYSAYCGHKMTYLRYKYPYSVWANPEEFFFDGPLVNLGADVALMPSKFEPGGIVQHEFFIAGTPVLGLRDTVYEFDIERHTGNGFTFEAYQMGDFLYAMERAYRVISDPAKYQKLRENAKYSVISCEQVAQAWLIEFCRLRRKLPVNYGRLAELSKKYAQTWDPMEWLQTYDSSNLHTSITAFVRSTTHSLEEQLNLESTTVSSLPKVDGPIRSKHTDKPGLVPAKIRFNPKPGHRPRAVAVSGSFDDWQVRRPMIWDNALQAYVINIALRPGHYVYKLIVDGDWILNPEAPAEKDSNGNLNNTLTVE